MIGLYTYSSAIAAIICFGLSILVYFRNLNEPVNRSSALLLISIGIWTSFPYVCGVTQDYQEALRLSRWVYLAALITPANFIRAISILLGRDKEKLIRWSIRISYTISTLFFPFAFSRLFIKDVARFQPNFYVIPGPLYYLFVLYFGIICGFTFYLIYKEIKRSTGLRRNQLRYVFTSFFIAFIGGVIHVSASIVNLEFIPHDIFIIGFGAILAYAIVGLRLMEINLAFQKITVQILCTSIVFFFMYWIIFPSYHPILKTILGIILAWLCTTQLPNLKTRLERFLNTLFGKKMIEKHLILERFIHKMPLMPEEEELITSTIKTINLTLDPERVILFQKDPVLGNFTPRIWSGEKPDENCIIQPDSALIEWFKEKRGIFVKDEAIKMPDGNKYRYLDLCRQLGLIIFSPCFHENDLLAIIGLGERRHKQMYTHIDLELLEKLSVQLALSLDYKRIERELRKKQEFEAIGTMALEISHEMKNLLVPIKTFFELLPSRYDDPEFRNTFSKIANMNVDIINKKIEDILFFGQERLPQWNKHTSINMIIEHTVNSLQHKAQEHNVELQYESDTTPPIIADPDLLVHTFTNIILNGIEALSEKGGGRIAVRSFLHPNPSESMKKFSREWIRVEVQDNGPGIPQKVKERLFTAFLTTKSVGDKRGTGLGLAVVKKIIDSHNGFIYVETEEGKGTKFIIDLPTTQKVLGFA